MAITLLEAHHAARLIPAGAPVALKPNLVVARPASGGATTHPDILRGTIEYLQDHGIRDITIMEGSWVGDNTRRAFDRCGYSDLARRYGVGLLDLKDDKTRSVDTPVGPIRICVHALEAGYLINIPVLKGHCQTRMTCALKNLKGCIPDSEKRRFHTMGLHRPIAALAGALRTDLTLVDSLCGDQGFEEGGNPSMTNRMYIGEDPVQLDVLGCRLIGMDPASVPYISLAEEFGAGSQDLLDSDVQEVDITGRPTSRPDIGYATPPVRNAAAKYPGVHENQACSACASALAKALNTLEQQGVTLAKLPPLYIGQGYWGQKVGGIGFGRCAGGLNPDGSTVCSSCPPTTEEILSQLRKVNT